MGTYTVDIKEGNYLKAPRPCVATLMLFTPAHVRKPCEPAICIQWRKEAGQYKLVTMQQKITFLLLWDILYSIAKKLHFDILKISFLYARPIYFAFVHFSKGLNSLASFC